VWVCPFQLASVHWRLRDVTPGVHIRSPSVTHHHAHPNNIVRLFGILWNHSITVRFKRIHCVNKERNAARLLQEVATLVEEMSAARLFMEVAASDEELSAARLLWEIAASDEGRSATTLLEEVAASDKERSAAKLL
jgi:hypothetical protein